MQLKPTSAVDDYQWIYPADEAIEYPEAPGKDATVEEKKAHLAAAAHIRDEIRQACETGDWERVPCKPGKKPAVWTLQHIRGRALRWVGHRSLGADKNEQIVVNGVLAAHVLMSVRELFIDDKPFRVERVRDRELEFDVITDEQFELLCSVDGGLLITMMAGRAGESVHPKKKA